MDIEPLKNLLKNRDDIKETLLPFLRDEDKHKLNNWRYEGKTFYINDRILCMKKNTLEIECNGALQVLSKVKDAISIFIIPPSIEELERRLRGRNTEGEEVIQKRLKKAEEELALQSHYKYAVVNDEIDRVVKEVDEIFEKEVYAK